MPSATEQLGGSHAATPATEPSPPIAHLDPAHLDPAQLDLAQLDLAQLDPAQLDPAQLDPTQLDPALAAMQVEIVGKSSTSG
jgi:hypothetical protein